MLESRVIELVLESRVIELVLESGVTELVLESGVTELVLYRRVAGSDIVALWKCNSRTRSEYF